MHRNSTAGVRLAVVTGPAFVVLVLVGNSLTESVVDPNASTLDRLAAQAVSTTVHVGLAAELLAFSCLAVFVAALHTLLGRSGAASTAANLATVAGTVMIAVKLGSGAAYLAALSEHERLSEEAATALLASNGAAFMLCWLPWGLFVGACAVALHGTGLVGRVSLVTGVAAGGLAVAATLSGVTTPDDANPMPFLLGLVWVLVVGARFVVRPPSAQVDARARSSVAHPEAARVRA